MVLSRCVLVDGEERDGPLQSVNVEPFGGRFSEWFWLDGVVLSGCSLEQYMPLLLVDGPLHGVNVEPFGGRLSG